MKESLNSTGKLFKFNFQTYTYSLYFLLENISKRKISLYHMSIVPMIIIIICTVHYQNSSLNIHSSETPRREVELEYNFTPHIRVININLHFYIKQ